MTKLIDRLERPDAFLSRSDLRELGLERRAVDAIFRACPVVQDVATQNALAMVTARGSAFVRALQRRPDRALLARAAAGREAVSFGADPVLTLALVVWPNERVTAAQMSKRSHV